MLVVLRCCCVPEIRFSQGNFYGLLADWMVSASEGRGACLNRDHERKDGGLELGEGG